MWGHVLTEASTQQNFNFGFSTYKSEILIHLSQWQYWWWFWFSMWWALYYFIILRTMTKRTFNFNIAMNTSVRGRGKWGDFLVALIPLSWCCNILINSNFILRMIEWQNESSLFTIRIQGKQWYWVYKYDPNTAQAVMSTPKNIGHNRWRVTSGQESYNADTYYQAIHLVAHLEFQDSYTKFTKKIDTHKKNLTSLSLSNEKLSLQTFWNTNTKLQSDSEFNTLEGARVLNFLNSNKNKQLEVNLRLLEKELNPWLMVNDQKEVYTDETDTNTKLQSDSEFNTLEGARVLNFLNLNKNKQLEVNLRLLEKELNPWLMIYTDETDTNHSYLDSSFFEFTNAGLRRNDIKINTLYNYNLANLIKATDLNFTSHIFEKFYTTANDNFNAYYDFLQLDETADADSNTRHHLVTRPFRLLKGVLNNHVVDVLQSNEFETTSLSKPLLFNTKFCNSGEALKDKDLMTETLWGFRQKKYKRMKKFKFKPDAIYDPVTFKVIGNKPLPNSPKVDFAGLDALNLNVNSLSKMPAEDISIKNRQKATEDNFNYRISSQINRHRSELVPVTLARRLLRTKRTLVLPAHVNLTLITNSYDVVHSWFVPGLGLKIDCVPGRSTHHTFYIDNIGFYYGQCAEICGRYHHHMPIRLCALPFEHFVVWWQAKGLARMNRTTEISSNRFLQQTFNNPVTKEKLIFRMN